MTMAAILSIAGLRTLPSHAANRGLQHFFGLCEFLGQVFTLIMMQPELLSAAASKPTVLKRITLKDCGWVGLLSP